MTAVDTLGLYLSIPFCRAKCSYCNFASDVFATGRMDAYVDRLCQEMREAPARAAALQAQLPEIADTVYFGGGTPTLLAPAHFDQIFRTLREVFRIDPTAEITVECAPGQLPAGTLEALLRHGLNRVSLGIQSFVDQESRAVGRLHTREICLAEVASLRSHGVQEINLDLIAGLPHQTETSWQRSLDELIETGVPHASVYMLEVDEESRLGRELIAGGVRYHAHHVPDDGLVANLYTTACDQLGAAGISQYEISNFARSGQESRHNLRYWTRSPYLGLGLDAHSMLASGTGSVRFANTDNLDHYQQAAQHPEPTEVTPEEETEERLFLGLRLNRGLDLDHFPQPLPNLDLLLREGLLVSEGRRLMLTAKGRLLSNEVFAELLSVPA